MSRSQILPTCNGCDLRDSALAEKDAIRFKMNSWNEELQRLCAEKDAEIVRIKEKLKIAVEALEDAIENMCLSELFECQSFEKREELRQTLEQIKK